MIRNNNLGALMGAPVLGKDDEKIGTVGQIFVDPATDTPNWMTVHTGLFGRHETFVPLQDAQWDHERVRIDFDKETIKAAPRIGTDEALSPEDEENLYRYYRVSADGGKDDGAGKDDTARHDDARHNDDRHDDARHNDDRHDDDRDQSQRSGSHVEPSGGGRLKRFVVTEQETVTVPVRHEELRIEPEMGTGAHVARTDDDDPSQTRSST